MEIWAYNSKENTFDLVDGLPEEFGTSDDFEKNYSCWTTYPENADGTTTIYGSGLTVLERRIEAPSYYPRYVVDLTYGDGDILCFRASWSLWKWLSSVMPIINYIEIKNKNQEEKNEEV